jgi:hypothetical protein
MRAGLLGMVTSPRQGNRLIPGVPWAGDNGGFTGKYAGDGAYLDWLAARAGHAAACAFVTAPDVLCDAGATLARSVPVLPRIRGLGFPAALVAQDGLERLAVPWDDFDVLFLGGSTAWKLGPGARQVTAAARRRGKHVHMGRVNSLVRLRYACAAGCGSADGTFLAFGPDRRLPELLGWLRAVPHGATAASWIR